MSKNKKKYFIIGQYEHQIGQTVETLVLLLASILKPWERSGSVITPFYFFKCPYLRYQQMHTLITMASAMITTLIIPPTVTALRVGAVKNIKVANLYQCK